MTNPVKCENLLPGDPGWEIDGSGDGSIQGFATDMSVDFGGTVDFKVNTDSANYQIDIYRLGYYGGAGARKIATLTRSSAQSQPACVTEPATGLYDCGNWDVSASWVIPDSAVSGMHIAKLTRLDGSQGSSHIYFIVRDDTRQADVLFQTSDTTWQAYNMYGGGSTYCGGPVSNANTVYGCAGRAVKVSYNRPFTTRDNDATSFLFNAEYPMIRWLEANGYDTKYWSGVDTDRLGPQLTGAKKPKIFLSVGHDEYWSGAQRAAVESARNAGVNLAFLSGNEVYWKTRWESSNASGTTQSHRTLVTYKETLLGTKIDPAVDPVTGLPIWTGTWRDTRFSPPNADGGRPENALIGQIWTVNCCSHSIQVPVAMKNLRIWQNTRVAELTSGFATLGSETLGYEWGEALENGFQPAGLVRLSSTTATDQQIIQTFGADVSIGTATHSLTLYRHNSGALVFGAGTVQWSWGLDGVHDRGPTIAEHTPDQAMQQATVTLFADMGAQPDSLQPGAEGATRPLVTVAQSTDIFAPTSTISSPAQGGTVESGERITITGTAVDPNGGVVAGVEVSVNNGTTWNKAQGTTSWAFDWSPGAIGQATIRTRAIDDRGNLEIAGAGTTVTIANGACPCPHLFKPSALPANPNFPDNSPYELGVKFRSDIAGFINGIRYYKSVDNSGTHLGNLWSAAGTLLATATFVNESASGWQEVLFASPVAIEADTIYVASYHTNVGHYAISPGYFTDAGVNSPPLHAPTSGESGGNGVFAGGASAFPSSSFNGGNYWVDVVFSPTNTDEIAPVITNLRIATIDSSKAEVRWTTSEAATSRVDYSTDQAFPPAATFSVSSATFKTAHFLSLNGLTPNTTYHLRVISVDGPGNTATVTPPTITLPGPTLRDTAQADFAAGAVTGTYVSGTGNGELMLAPAMATEFNGTSLPAGWLAVPWGFGGFASVANGALKVDGSRVGTCAGDPCQEQAVWGPGRTYEFVATFTGDAFQHAGLAVTLGSTSEPWAIFSTLTGGNLYVRTNTGSQSQDVFLGGTYLGGAHRYRIDWKADGTVDYFIDGIFKASSPLQVTGLMRPVAASDFSVFGGNVIIDWVRMTPHASSGEFVSRVFDAGAPVDWQGIQWVANTPSGTTLDISLRTGDTATPDASWTAFVPILTPGALDLQSRYIQYGAVLGSADPAVTPVLEDIIITTGHTPVAVNDPDAPLVAISVPENGTRTFPAAGPGSLTANDLDGDVNDVLRVIAVTAPSHGTIVLSLDGSVVYTPAPSYNGPDAFSYTVSDGLLTSSATVTLNVTFENNAPEALADYYNIDEDTSLSVPASQGILANDSDPENSALRAVLVSPPSHAASFSLSANGAFSYTPFASFAGPDIFTYKANDGDLDSPVTSVQILMNQVNDPPITEPDMFTAVLAQEKLVAAPGVLANDHDIEVEDTAPLHAQLVSPPANGVLIFNPNGSFSYTPNSDFLGIDTFTYQAIDHFDAVGNVGTVTMTVGLKAVSEAAPSGGTVSTGAGVTAGDPLQSAVTTPTPATVSIAQGVITNSVAPAGFTFLNQQVNITVTDGAGNTVSATAADPFVFSFLIDRSLIPVDQDPNTFDIFRNGVRVPECLGQTSIPAANLNPCISGRVVTASSIALTILSTNASAWNFGLEDNAVTPAQADGPYVAAFETPLVVSAPGVLGNDFGDRDMTAQLSGTPEGGSVDLSLSGAFTFTPNTGFCGPASFRYTAHTGAEVSNVGVVTLVVNCNPDADDDTVTMLEDSEDVMISVLVNDDDPDPGQTATLRIDTVTQPDHGTVVALAGQPYVTYTPHANFFGTDSFTYSVKDSLGGISTGTVHVTVTAVNDAPSFVKGADQTVLEDAAAQSIADWASNLSAGLGAENAQVLSFSVSNSNNALFATQPAIAPAGTLTFAPAANANGSATVTVLLVDDGGTADGGVDTSAAQTFTISITPVNDDPVANADSTTVAEDSGTNAIDVLGNDNLGPDTGETLTVTAVTEAAHGTVTFTATGVSYAPAADYNGADSFTHTIADGNGGTATTTVSVTVTPVNDDPVAVNDSATVTEDSGANAIDVLINDNLGPDTGETLTVTAVTQPAHGTVTFTAAGVSYTPAADYYGPDSFTHTIADGNGGSATATVSVTVTPVNDNPVANNDSATVAEDSGANAIDVLANDNLGPDAGETLTVTAVTVAAHGTATFTATGVSYTPAADYNGPDSITYTIEDGNGGSTTATISITVTPVNDDPVATDDSATVAEDSGANAIDVLANDNLGPDTGETLTVSAVTQGAHGTVTFTATGVSYTPAADYYGPDSFTHTIADGNGGTATATVSVTVTPVNDNPVANNDSATVAEDSGATAIDVLVNDNLGPDAGETLTVTAVTVAAHGTATFTATGVSYTPAADYNGADSITYTIEDGNGGSTTATISITVTPVNDDPVATDDSATVAEDSGANAIDVLANDNLGPDTGETLTVTAVTQGAHGAVTFTAAGVSYTPAADYYGPDSFTHTIADGNGGSATATVSVTVTPVNDNPVANNDSATVAEDSGANAIAVLANDNLGPDAGETLTVTAVTQATHGAVTFTETGVTYTPAADYYGDDSFTYTIADGNGGSATTTVSVTVTPVNDNPVANNDSATVAEDSGANAIDVLANDNLGPDAGETLTVTAVTAAAHGTATFTATGVSYTPAADYNGPDSITYTIADGNGGTTTATINITVTPVNDDPVATADSTTIAEDSGANVIDVLANDNLGPDTGETLTVTAVTQGAHGSVTFTATGVSYAPAADYYGPDSFTHTIADGNGGTATATVSVTVTPVNDNPVANDDGATVAEDSGATGINVLANDTLGPDTGETLTITAVTQGAHGSVTFTATGVSYTPAADYNGADSFTHTITDGNGGSATATVNVTVTAVNDDPVATDDSATIAEDSAANAIDVLANDNLGPDTGETLTVTAVTQGAHGAVTFTASGVSYTPAADYYGPDSFTHTIADGNGGSATATVNVTVTAVNDDPVATDDSSTVAEDGGAAAIAVLANDNLGPDTGETLTVTGVTQGAHGSVTFTATGASYTPAADYYGPDSFTYTIADGNGGSATATVSVTVTAVNDAPGFTKGADQTLLEDTGTQAIANWATQITAGPGESSQVITFQVTNDNNALFSTQPVIAANGTLSYDPAPNANGLATVTVTATDNGGIADGGVDISAPQIFTINVSLLNDAPAFTQGPNQTVLEDSSAQAVAGWATGMTAGPADESGQALSFTVSNNNNALFLTQPAIAPDGTLTFAAAPDAVGAATVTVVLRDDGGVLNGGSDTSVEHTFSIAVTPINDTPSFTAGANQVALEDSGPATVAGWATTLTAGPADESGQALSFIVTADNTALFAVQPAIAENGTLTFTPAANAGGSATVTVQLRDNGGTDNGAIDTSAAQTFTIDVTGVNDAPSFVSGAAQTSNEDAGAQTIAGWASAISAGPANEAGQGRSFIVSNDNAVLFAAAPAIGADGTLTYTAALNQFGSAVVSVRLLDDGGTANGGVDTTAIQTFAITVNAVNDNPTAAADTATVMQGSTANSVDVLANDSSAPDGAETLTITAVTQGANGAVAITGAGTTVSYTPNASFTGSDTFTYTIGDGNGGSATASVAVTVVPMPSIRIENLSVTEGNSGFTEARFPVTLSHASTATVTVNYQTFNGSARDGRDYVSISGTVTFAPGEISKVAFVQVIGETTKEKDETFAVRLSAPVKATIARIEAVGVIVDDDTTPQATASNTKVVEGDGTFSGDGGSNNMLSFRVELSNLSEIPVSVAYMTLGLGAKPVLDFDALSGVLEFGEDELVKYITIPIVGDRQHEALERVRLRLHSPIEMILKTTEVDGDIEDDDPAPTVSVADVKVVEGNLGTSNAIFTVSLSEAAGKTETVTYTTADGTATAGSDYTAVSGTLTFVEGATSMTVTVPVVGDTTIEPSETFTLYLSTGSDVTLKRSQGIATIVNDDSSTWVSGTYADLSTGIAGAGAYLVDTADGAVILQPRLAAEFSGTTLPVGWTKGSLGTATIAGGVATLDGTQVQNVAGFFGNQSLEFAATYNSVNQYMGFAQLRFYTKTDGKLYALTMAPKNAGIETVIPGNWLGAQHRFRIDWKPGSITYSIDGVVVATHLAIYPSNTAMTAMGGDLGVGGGVLALDWVRVSPYQPSGDFTSAVFDAGAQVTWATASWTTETPVGTGIAFQVRTGDTPTPDATWTGFVPVLVSGSVIGTQGRYVQYQAVLTTTLADWTPVLKEVVITYTK